MIRLCVLLVAGLAAGAVVIDASVKARTRTRWHAMGGEVAEATLGGSLPRLLRGQLVGLRALAEEPAPRELAANVAYLNAMLACEHGQPTERLAREALARATPPGGVASPTAVATNALLALCQGDTTLALALARTALDTAEPGLTAQVPGAPGVAVEVHRDPRPLLVLGRAHLLRGELQAASQVLEAASVRAPTSAAALVGWSEARLGLGERAGVIETLREALRRAPGDTRALLLLEEAARAAGDAEAPAVARERALACARDATSSSVLAVACELAAAVEARLAGDRKRAGEHARKVGAAKRAATRERVLASVVLTQTGEVDAATTVLESLSHEGEETPPVHAWAQAAVALGRGEPPPRNLPSLPVHPETHLVAARTALAEGGPDALAGVLAALGAPAVAADPDLRALSLIAAATPPAPAGQASSPVQAYAQGLRALAAGDPTAATRWLAQALAGHGDACRAVAVYLPALALTGRVPGDELTPLGAANGGCRELRWIEETSPTTAPTLEPTTNTKTN